MKPFGFLLLLEVTHIECSARKLPDLRKSIFMCGLSQEKKRYQARWVYPKFIINLPSETWKVSEVHHGALLKKPLLIYISYFPPSHFLWKKEGWPSSTVWMLDCYTPTASVAVGVDKTFLFALFSGPHRGSIPALVEISRLWAQADFSAEMFSKPRGIKITR